MITITRLKVFKQYITNKNAKNDNKKNKPTSAFKPPLFGFM